MENFLETVKSERANIEKYNAEKSEQYNDLKYQIRKIDREYDEKIDQLKAERRKLVDELENKKYDLSNEHREYVKNNSKNIEMFNDILKLMDKDNINEDVDFVYNGKDVVVLDDKFYHDDTLSLKVVYSTNKKPSNKYSLSIIGKSIFKNTSLIRYMYEYNLGVDLDVTYESKIIIPIKDFSSVSELKKYYEKNKDKFTLSFIEQHNELVKLYQWTKENTNTIEWEFEFLQFKKSDYENNYSRYQEEDEYQNILKRLNEIEMKEKYKIKLGDKIQIIDIRVINGIESENITLL